MLKFIADLSFYCSPFEFMIMIPLDNLLNTGSGFGQNCNFLFLGNFLNCAFHLVCVVATTTLSCYCSHFEWPEIWYAGVSWPPSELIRFWSRSGDFPYFGVILTWWNRSNLGFLAIFFRMHERNGLKFDMVMYPGHPFNGLHFGHGLLIFFILGVFWLSETSQICSFRPFTWECMGGLGYN